MKKTTIIILIMLPIVIALVCLCIGRIGISPGEVIKALTGSEEIKGTVRITIINVRLPRILLGLLCGAGLAVAGCSFQSFFSNPLATPDTMGVAGGASFGAALGLLLGFDMIGVQVLSFLFGAGAVLVTKLAASGRNHGPAVLIISGIMVGSLFSALVSLVKFVADAETQLPAITYWLMGSLGSAGYKNLAMGAPIIIISIIIIFLLRWRMNLLSLSEDELIASGTNVKLLRTLVVICAAAMTSSVISMCGQVGWVGLIVPHMCRMIWGQDNKKLIPASISIGAAFMVIVDTVARSISAAEIPVSILTAIIGAPFFIFILTYRRKSITGTVL
ncbi:MAG: iron ABC transporter permease [Lachnospiraceae bacterium]|nr:iron ABC transporter permease [Lachnospiraceae bacterium]